LVPAQNDTNMNVKLKGAKAIRLTPHFNVQHANKSYYNASLQLLPGFEYFFSKNSSTGFTFGPDIHMRKSGDLNHYHYGITSEFSFRKYIPLLRNKLEKFNKVFFLSAGASHSFRWNHYHSTATNVKVTDNEANFKPFIDLGGNYFLNQFVIEMAIRSNYRYDSDASGKQFNSSPDFEMNYYATIKYFLK
jgi:hypothetical protein